jgi:uncharacterized membrane protein
MIVLLLGLALFLGVHSVRIFAEAWRGEQIARWGLNAWKAMFGVASLLGFVLIVIGFARAREDSAMLWLPPVALRHLAGLLTAVSFVLLAATYVPGTRIKAKVGHPMVAGVKSWAFAHLLANGSAADVVLFGAFLAWGIVSFSSSRRRDRQAGTVYPAGSLNADLIAVAGGLVAWFVFAFWLHGWLFGVRPFG